MRTTTLLILLALSNPVHAEPITLARGGKPAATIVLPPHAPERLARAAAELQTYVGKICGVELPIRRDGKQMQGAGLYLGACDSSLPSDPPDKKLNPETYAIRVRKGSLYFAGRYPTATYFAVVSFIEDNLGVRWFAPGETWQYVPSGKPGELTVEVREVVKTPDTSPRVWSGHEWTASWVDWNYRNKTAINEVVPRRQFQNNLHRVFPPAKYAKTHPEYYPLINGKRWIPAPGDRYWRPCESSPEVIRLTVEYARKWFDEHPDVDSFSVGMDDVSHLCSCPNCRALDPHPDSYEKREFSDRHYKFVNAIAREISKTHPDRYVGTLIYNIARRPPETVPKLEDNVFGYLTENCSQWWQPGRREEDHALTCEWARRCKHVSRYDYYGLGTCTPRFYPHSMAEQIKFDKSLGLEGMYVEVYTFLPHTAPMIWALSKLQWDASLDIDALLDEFYGRMFGRSAATMKAYYALQERAYNTARPGRAAWEHRNLVSQAQALAAEDVDAGMALLEKARTQAENDLVRGRIETIRAALQYSGYAIKAYALSQRLMASPVQTPPEAESAIADVGQIMRLSAEREQFWPAAMKRDDLLGENLRGLGKRGYLVIGQAPRLEQGGVVGALRALDWYGEHAPEQLASIRQRLVAAAPTGDVARAVQAYLWVRENRPPNLVMNSGFEEQGKNTARPTLKDQQTTGAPRGWRIWQRTGDSEIRVVAGKGRNGSAGAQIARGAGGSYLQTVQARPGERYLVTAWARCISSQGKALGGLAARFVTRGGGWLDRRELEPSVSLPPGQDWQPMILFVTVPEGAGGFTLLLGADHPRDEATVFYDDVAAHRLPEN